MFVGLFFVFVFVYFTRWRLVGSPFRSRLRLRCIQLVATAHCLPVWSRGAVLHVAESVAIAVGDPLGPPASHAAEAIHD